MKFDRDTHSRIFKNCNFKKAWKILHKIENCESICIPKGCDDLKFSVVRESTSPRKKLSIDTSAKILAGMAMDYSKQIDTIYEEMFNIAFSEKNTVVTQEILDKQKEPILRSSSSAEYHNKTMNMTLEISPIIKDIVDNDNESESRKNEDEESIENDVDQESNEAQSSPISSKLTYDSHHEYIRKYENPNINDSNKTSSDDDSSDNEGESNHDSRSSRVENESSSENEYEYVNNCSSNSESEHRLSTIPEVSENVTSLRETEGNQDLEEIVTDELNMPKSPIISSNMLQIVEQSVSYLKSPIISWPTSQTFKDNSENNNNNFSLKALTLQIPTTSNALDETLASHLLLSPIIITKAATTLQENPSKRKYFDTDPDRTEISENEKRAKKNTEESNNNKNVNQDKSPIIPYKDRATENQSKINLEKLAYINNSTQTENIFVHLSDEEDNKSDKSDNGPVCNVLIYNNNSEEAPTFLIHAKVNPKVMKSINELANSLM